MLSEPEDMARGRETGTDPSTLLQPPLETGGSVSGGCGPTPGAHRPLLYLCGSRSLRASQLLAGGGQTGARPAMDWPPGASVSAAGLCALRLWAGRLPSHGPAPVPFRGLIVSTISSFLGGCCFRVKLIQVREEAAGGLWSGFSFPSKGWICRRLLLTLV